MKQIIRNPTIGWYPDAPSEELAAQSWVEAYNVRFRSNAAERIPDSTRIGTQITYERLVEGEPSETTADPIMGFGYLPQSDGTELIVAFSRREIYAHSGEEAGMWDTDADDRLTPRYTTGQASCDGSGGVLGSNSPTDTSWTGGAGVTDNLPQPGDWIKFDLGSGVWTDWVQIYSVDGDNQITLVTDGVSTGGLVDYEIRLRQGTTRTLGGVVASDSLTSGDKRAWITATYFDPVGGTSMLIATNGYNTPIKWTGSGDFAVLGGLDRLEGGYNQPDALQMRFKAMAVYKNALWVGNTSESNAGGTALEEHPFRLRASNLGNCESWKAAIAEDQAGFFEMAEGGDAIVAMQSLGEDELIVYKERSIWRVTWIGVDDGTAEIDLIANTMGAMSRRAVASNGQVHCFIDSENVYLLLPGQQPIPIGNPIKRYWKQRVNRDGLDTNQVVWKPDTNEFWIIYAGEVGSSPATLEALILHLPDGTYTPVTDNQLEVPVWSHVSLPECTAFGRLSFRRYLTWAEVETAWEDIPTAWEDMYRKTEGFYIWGDLNGKTWYLERDGVEGAEAIERTGLLETPLSSGGDPFNYKLLRVGQFISDKVNETVGWHVGISMLPNHDAITWLGRDGQADGAFFRYLRNGRVEGLKKCAIWYALRGYLTSGDAVRIHGYQFYFEPRGVRR